MLIIITFQRGLLIFLAWGGGHDFMDGGVRLF